MTDGDELRVVLRARAGDRDSMEKLLSDLQNPLRAYISGIVGPTSADDVLQNTLIQICRDLKWLREPQLIVPGSYRVASRCSFKTLGSEK